MKDEGRHPEKKRGSVSVAAVKNVNLYTKDEVIEIIEKNFEVEEVMDFELPVLGTTPPRTQIMFLMGDDVLTVNVVKRDRVLKYLSSNPMMPRDALLVHNLIVNTSFVSDPAMTEKAMKLLREGKAKETVELLKWNVAEHEVSEWPADLLVSKLREPAKGF